MKRLLFAAVAVISAMFLGVFCLADEAESLKLTISAPGSYQLADGNRNTKLNRPAGDMLEITSDQAIRSLYLVFDSPAPELIEITSGGKSQLFGNGYLHDFIELENPSEQITISFSDNTTLCDIHAFSSGDPPSWVQRWRDNSSPCDVLMLPTHVDDDMMYFGAALALASDKENCEVQVAYMVDHSAQPYRPHEMLDGLWELNISRYPIVGPATDIYSGSLEHAMTVYDYDGLLEYKTALIKKLCPQIVFSNDFAGEQGHGAQSLNARISAEAVRNAALGEDSWLVLKHYVHLYDQNAITLDCDTPLESFGGATAFEMAVRGFSHNSQSRHFQVERGGRFGVDSFGLYHSEVGPDSSNDFFEGITLYSDAIPGGAGDAGAPEPAVEFFLPEQTAPAQNGGLLRQLYLPEQVNDRIIAFIGSPIPLLVLFCLPPVIFFAIIVRRSSEEDFEP